MIVLQRILHFQILLIRSNGKFPNSNPSKEHAKRPLDDSKKMSVIQVLQIFYA